MSVSSFLLLQFLKSVLFIYNIGSFLGFCLFVCFLCCKHSAPTSSFSSSFSSSHYPSRLALPNTLFTFSTNCSNNIFTSSPGQQRSVYGSQDDEITICRTWSLSSAETWLKFDAGRIQPHHETQLTRWTHRPKTPTTRTRLATSI